MHGCTKPRYAASEISEDRILLGRLALLSREGNHSAVAKQLAEWWDRECPEVGSTQGVREPRRNELSDPLTLSLSEVLPDLDDVRLVNALEVSLGVVWLWQLAHYPPKDVLYVNGLEATCLLRIAAALSNAGAAKAVVKRNDKWRPLFHRDGEVNEEGIRGLIDSHRRRCKKKWEAERET